MEICVDFVQAESFNYFHNLGHLSQLSESFLAFEIVLHSFDMADYNRSVEDNFRFLGVVGSLASTARNSDLVRVETSGYSCAAHGQISHTSNKEAVPLVCAVLAVLCG